VVRALLFGILYLLLLSSQTVLGLEVQIIDQHGNPVKNAVVSIPEGQIEGVSSEPAVMDQVKRQFSPLVLAVEKGREVVFPNSDNIRHHVYSFSKPKNFQIKLYKGVPKKPLLFDQPGIVVLGCNIHDSMIGYIFVSQWPTFKVTPSSGQVNFESSAKEIAVWHPWVSGLEKPERFLVSELRGKDFKIELNLMPPKPIKKLKNKFKKFYSN